MAEQGRKNDATEDLLYLAIALLIAFFIVKIFFGTDIIKGYLVWRLHVLKALYALFHAPILLHLQQLILSHPAKQWTMHDLGLLGAKMRWFMLPFFAVPIALLFWRSYHRDNMRNRFHRRFDMQGLARSQREIWPWLNAVIGLDLINKPLEKGPWRMAYTPKEFADHRQLWKTGTKDILDEDRVMTLYAASLGPLWSAHADHLPVDLKPHVRAILGCLMARIAGNKEASDACINDMLKASASGHFNGFKSGAQLAKKYVSHKDVQAVISAHAYVSTVMIGLMEAAWDACGILPPLQFIWLRPRDHVLWYLLDSCGRRTPFPEAAGSFSHYASEIRAGRPMEIPCVDSAVTALKDELKSFLYPETKLS